MEKQRFVTFTIIALLLINLGTLGYLFALGSDHGPRPPHPPHGRMDPKSVIIERLQLNKEQQVAYEALIQEHRSAIDEIETSSNTSKNQLYMLLNDSIENKAVKDSLIAAIAANQKVIEQIHFDHFKAIKKICKPEQLKNFEALTEELSALFSKPRRPPHD